ncbi:hypothetical protein JY651_25545 [Pyxidicoccus parkwayensis]|uniref:Lipoprotein n=1 Tax=Pyxidicoccus parkwayensis TaxID=2813578 RepID=A0ABX7NRA4_9BACT|nr:hypothetical protein [Pyxidicoccus parkwaysis]QSQ18728.1 hypothetical protein JY651_25545 [Pyxidicoccus parkwaysis]
MRRLTTGVLAVGVLLFSVGCGAGSPSRRGQGRYAQTVDSATTACERNPAYCAKVPGEETVHPLVVRAIQVSTAGRAWEVLDEMASKRTEDILVECATWADAEVNKKEFGGRAPTKQECEQQVSGTRENPVTRGMRLGSAKHRLAFQCADEKLSQMIPRRFRLEQRYRINPETQQLELATHKAEVEMLRNGGKDLVGSVVPDVVIHTGDPLQPQAVFEFKFPCPEDNPPSWRDYPPRPGQQASNQGAAYESAFGESPTIITPKGIF